jgi:acetyl-CoA carboxylase carboxyltransferase component
MLAIVTTDRFHLDDLAAREARAREGGGADKLARQHAKGRMGARERIDALLDAGTFDERGLLAHSDLPEAADRTPADGKVAGFGAIDAREVFVSADDVTVLAGAGGRVGVGKQFRGMQYAVKKGIPCIHLGDAGGARVPDIMGSTGMMSMVYPIDGESRDRRVPLVTAIMGECFGGAAWTASISDIVVQVKGSVMCVGGPSILEIATGEKSSVEELGGWELHARTTGQVDLFAADDAECLALVRRALSYFPSSALAPLPAPRAGAPAGERVEQLLDLVPEDPRQVYDMHAVIDAIVDAGSALELKPFFDGSLITSLARIDGQVVGILANNPKVTAGAMGPGACEKAVSFICLCDSFHIPLVFLHDTPGFFVGKRAEERAMPLRIMNFIEALHQSSVPRISVIVRKSYGMAHCNMSGGNMGNDLLLAWPTADVSFMAPAVAVNVVYGRKLAADKSGGPTRAELMEEISRANAPWAAAGPRPHRQGDRSARHAQRADPRAAPRARRRRSGRSQPAAAGELAADGMNRQRIVDAALILLLAACAAFATIQIRTLRESQTLAEDLAELNNVKYGLLNADAWVRQIAGIVERKITTFEVRDDNRAVMKRSLERMLDALITQGMRHIRRQNLRGEGWKRAKGQLKQEVQDALVDIKDVKSGIPQYADAILDEMDKPASRRELTELLSKMVHDVAGTTFAELDLSRLEQLHRTYACDDRETCARAISARIDDSKLRAVVLTSIVLGLTLLLFIAIDRAPSTNRLGLLALACAILMLCGVLTPMIDVEARISELRFVLLEEPVVFTNQVLYFQSKSVVDVVRVLTSTGALDMMLVGILIMTFSVVFPLAKLVASFVYLHDLRGWRRAPLVRFFALKSGKWSMADVMVIAIFMAYIGFNGMISSQLSNFAQAAGGDVDILTTNGTSLQIGFFMFLAFCLASLVASTRMQTQIERP